MKRVQFSPLEAPQLLSWFHVFSLAWLSCHCRFSLNNLDLPCSFIPSSLSITRILEFSLVFGCGALHLVPLITGWSFYDDSWCIHQSDYRVRSIQAPSPLLLEVWAWVILLILGNICSSRFIPSPIMASGLNITVSLHRSLLFLRCFQTK